jgi:hypothetical protein
MSNNNDQDGKTPGGTPPRIIAMPGRAKPFAALESRHRAYVLDDIAILCEVGGISHTTGHDHHTPFAEMLGRMRAFNIAARPLKPLDIQTLSIFAGARATHLFENNFKAAANAPQLDLTGRDARNTLIERVLQDSGAVLPAVTQWLNTDGNARFGHYMAQGENAAGLLDMKELALAAKLDGAALFARINTALEDAGLAPMPSPFTPPPRSPDGKPRLHPL